MTRIGEVISWRLRPARDVCQEAMLGCPGLGYTHLGALSVVEEVEEVVGVEWWGEFGSSVTPPYKC